MRRHFAAFMPRKSLDIRTTDYPCDREKGLTALFPASGEDGSGQGPANGSRDWSLVGFGARPQGLKPSISAIFKVLLSLFFSARFFIDYLTLPICTDFLFFFNCLQLKKLSSIEKFQSSELLLSYLLFADYTTNHSCRHINLSDSLIFRVFSGVRTNCSTKIVSLAKTVCCASVSFRTIMYFVSEGLFTRLEYRN